MTLYWLTNNVTSSARLYWKNWENSANNFNAMEISVPVGATAFSARSTVCHEVGRAWLSQPIYWNEVKKGGHFAARKRQLSRRSEAGVAVTVAVRC
jgi:hypothetical protein